MKNYVTYVCETCGKESKNPKDISECEAAHLGLSVDEHFQYKGMKEIVRRCSATLYSTNNDDTRKKYDDAIEELVQFKKEHAIKG